MNWTPNHIEILRKKYARQGANIPELLKHRSKYGIHCKARRLKLVFENYEQNGKWKSDLEQILIEQYPLLGPRIPELRGIFSHEAICAKAKRLKLRYQGVVVRKSDGDYKQWEIDILHKKYPLLGTAIPELSHRSANSIGKKAAKLGIRYKGPINNNVPRSNQYSDVEVAYFVREVRPRLVNSSDIYKELRRTKIVPKEQLQRIIQQVLADKPRFKCPSCGKRDWYKVNRPHTFTTYWKCKPCTIVVQSKSRAETVDKKIYKPKLPPDKEVNVYKQAVDYFSMVKDSGFDITPLLVRRSMPDFPANLIGKLVREFNGDG